MRKFNFLFDVYEKLIKFMNECMKKAYKENNNLI